VSERGKNRRDRGRRIIRNAAIVINLVWTFTAVIFGGFFAGYFLDKWLGTSPALTLLFSFLGIAAAIYLVLREAPRLLG
jgi:F0F1-type ATP synthase assembly protein I